MANVADLQPGQQGVIKEFKEDILPLKLLELGCLPGNTVQLIQIAPLNDPIYVNVSGCHIAIRKSLARKIELEAIQDISSS